MSLYLVILLMALVTITPRLAPVLIMDRVFLPSWTRKWLNSIPYAVLGALIFPGVLRIQEGNPGVGLLGALVAGVCAYLRLPMALVIGSSIVIVMMMRFTL